VSARFLVYGAYGYTGRRIAARAVERGHRPVLAGRDPRRLAETADPLGLPARAFALDDPAALAEALADVDAVVHVAGPFSATSAPMVAACLAARRHYLDVTGEIDVFEAVLARGAEAADRGVALVPGVGFDVVPTDCLARALHERLPEAVALDLAIHTRGAASRGTARTMVEGLGRPGRVRRGGRIVDVPAAWSVREIPFPDRPRTAVSIPWGDVSTAWHSTGIPDVTVCLTASAGMLRTVRVLGRLRQVLAARPAQAALRWWVDRAVAGPDEAARRAGSTQAWGEVRDRDGRAVRGWVRGPEGYTLTADAAVRAVERVLAGVPAGAWTPSRAFGSGFVRELDGVEVGGDVA